MTGGDPAWDGAVTLAETTTSGDPSDRSAAEGAPVGVLPGCAMTT
ncbi:MAG TPA: hypothetical protein VER39_13245 [Nocardioidaceae bacterium]|nr:hypothetical protein [Nocardioidaceae bacterium]